MSTRRIILMMFAVATGTTLGLLLISDIIQGTNDPTVWTNTLAVITGVLVSANVSLANRERLERHQAEQDLAEIRDISGARSYR